MSNPAIVSENVSVLEPLPVTSLKQELTKFAHYPFHVPISVAAQIMQNTVPGARLLHDRCEMICAGRNDMGHRLFRRDGCVTYRWLRQNFYNPASEAESAGWGHG
ncbi:hypothetical protein IWQ55_006482 [Labrenzia sp. EL_208]|nr:hypothetical protein [Labrenzia sp. EL_132]MBG6233244.1 hypothetical protein [Labrenzia sp. EL_208]